MKTKRQLILNGLLVAGSLLLGGAGCSKDQPHTRLAGAVGRGYVPLPPEFMSGAGSLLLTNRDGYAALATVTSGTADHQRMVSGPLVVRGSKFYFDAQEDSTDLEKVTGQFGYIWDAGTGRGYVLSDALQGYAPIGNPARYTRSVVEAARPTADKIEGYTVERAEAAVTDAAGETSRFEMWQAPDMANVVVRIRSLDDAVPYTLTLSKVQLQAPPENLFNPPADFTAFQTAQMMMNELVARDQSAHSGGRKYEPMPDVTESSRTPGAQTYH